MTEFHLPKVINELIAARDKLRSHYSGCGLNFTLDGNLVGDIGEALAVELFGITLSKGNAKGIDGHAPDGRSVQVKATGTARGPAFRNVDKRADHLLFFDLDFEGLAGTIVFNGPEAIALESMPASWENQKSVSKKNIEAANLRVADHERLPIIT